MLKTIMTTGLNLAEEKVMIGLSKSTLENIFDTYCKAKNIKGVKLVLTGDATWNKYLRNERVNGSYNSKTKTVVVKVRENKAATIETLMHELTHAYQDVYHKDMLNYGRTQKATYSADYGYDAYYYSVHEQHARICGADLGKIARRAKDNKALYNAFKKFNMEDAFYRIDTVSYAV